jgi:hypothetical protein
MSSYSLPLPIHGLKSLFSVTTTNDSSNNKNKNNNNNVRE